jgi:hypothetical protein
MTNPTYRSGRYYLECWHIGTFKAILNTPRISVLQLLLSSGNSNYTQRRNK